MSKIKIIKFSKCQKFINLIVMLFHLPLLLYNEECFDLTQQTIINKHFFPFFPSFQPDIDFGRGEAKIKSP